MAVWSSFRNLLINNLKNKGLQISKQQNVKFSVNPILRSDDHGPRLMKIVPSRFQWDKFKDLVHYYVMVGAIPCAIALFYSNVFIGPAQLTPIPEGYVPKHWEYHRHPITRFIARYLITSSQQEYEKYMHAIFEEDEKMRIRILEKRIKAKMDENKDFKSFYYRPHTAKYIRAYRDTATEVQERLGDQEP